jgi:hypothetical protein
MRRSELEKLTTVSVRGELYVKVDEVVEALKAEKAEAEAASAETTTRRAVPRAVEPDKEGKA